MAYTSFVATGRLSSACGPMRNAFDRLPAFPGSKTKDQNELFGFAMYHCLAASNTVTDN